MKFVTRSRVEIEHSNPMAASHIIISICGPYDPDVQVVCNPSTKGLLRLRFEDSDGKDPNAFCMEDAYEIQDFIEDSSHRSAEVCIVHCHMGWSRSTGLALALSRFYSDTELLFRPPQCPNKHVTQSMLNALYEERKII